ncbi:MAG: PEP-CTERM sorting domain-containing protein [Planctomycetota bacterium]
MTRKLLIVLVISGFTTVLTSREASAQLVGTPTLSIEAGLVGNTVDIFAQGTVQNLGGGTFQWTLDNPIVNGQGAWNLDQAVVTFESNPFVSQAFSFTNITGNTADFVFSSSVISSVDFASPVISGNSAVNVNVAAAATTDATLAALSNDSVYAASIGADEVQTLFDGPFSITTPSAGSPVGSDSGNFESVSTPGVSLEIGEVVTLSSTFSLTGDSNATFSNVLAVVPEPASLALVAAGGLLTLGRRRR